MSTPQIPLCKATGSPLWRRNGKCHVGHPILRTRPLDLTSTVHPCYSQGMSELGTTTEPEYTISSETWAAAFVGGGLWSSVDARRVRRAAK